eukprot:6892448-Prymnesium_polylepis.1
MCIVCPTGGECPGGNLVRAAAAAATRQRYAPTVAQRQRGGAPMWPRATRTAAQSHSRTVAHTLRCTRLHNCTRARPAARDVCGAAVLPRAAGARQERLVRGRRTRQRLLLHPDLQALLQSRQLPRRHRGRVRPVGPHSGGRRLRRAHAVVGLAGAGVADHGDGRHAVAPRAAAAAARLLRRHPLRHVSRRPRARARSPPLGPSNESITRPSSLGAPLDPSTALPETRL